MTRFQKKLWIGLLIMTLLTPLGILLPQKFKAEGAWGEWGTDKLEKLLGHVPEGLKRWAGLWKSPIPDYNFGGEGASMTLQVFSYIVSGLLGIGICAFVAYMISRFMARHGK
ncbi:MAG TPA: PDGLE domain-containing protein [Thermodesulfobacteriota bacterium]|jgi:cobalt/nickel transport protein|nr:PDGLE domain-containing protein [Thermodesulfobacteriota bacterium]